jgi:hypothetical protein
MKEEQLNLNSHAFIHHPSAFILTLRRSLLASLLFSTLMLSLACRGANQNENASTSKRDTPQKTRRVTNEKFLASLPPGFTLPDDADEVGNRVLADYGAVFVARGDAVAPPAVVFADEAEVSRWQSSVKRTRADFGGINVELQSPAMTALLAARDEAQQSKLDITPRGTDAARRTYTETVKLWQSRVNPGLTHWARDGRLTKEEAERIRALSPHDQIPEILRLEDEGLYFSTDFSKSILYSVAAPGTSQHISMLAFDVKEYDNPAVRSILARHGWFQTVSSDMPHFTFLGVKEEELPSLGLKKTTNGGRAFWIPDL